MKEISVVTNKYDIICIAIVLSIVGLFSILYIIYEYQSLQKIEFSYNLLIPIILMSICMLINYPVFQLAVANAPNPAFAHCIINLNVILVAIVATYVYKSKINIVSFTGIILAIIGILLVTISEHYN